MGLAYNGTVSKTKTGRNCKSWERITINNERQTDQHNYCRNLHEDLNGPWCFTTDPDVLWEYCSIPLCAKECLENTKGLAYKGTVSTTRTGLNCSNWEGLSIYNEPQTDQFNYCRNPTEDPNGPWCFTTDPDVWFEECSIPLCDDVDITTKPAKDCKNNQLGVDYTGTVSTTETGRTCQYWSERYPHSHIFTYELADQQNYCRNSDNEPLGPWCYTTDSEVRWQYCTVPLCEKQNSRMNQQGKNYTGKINKTRFGQKCQAWTSLVPNLHPFWIKLANDENYCRNPDTELYGPWCYTTDPGTRWEYCDVPYFKGADKPSKENWKYGWQGFEDSCYSIQYTEKSWVDAKDFCKSNLGAYLAEITTPEENDFLMNLLPKPTVDNRVEVWLGARDLERGGQFTWDNSATYLDYTDWGPKEPNGYYHEDCLATHLYRDGKLHWNDRACAARYFFVCEKMYLNYIPLLHCLIEANTFINAVCLSYDFIPQSLSNLTHLRRKDYVLNYQSHLYQLQT